MSGSGGRIAFARLAWPGYSATIDGIPAPVASGPAGLLVLSVPAGVHAIEINYHTPGLTLGLFLVIGALLVVLVWQMLLWRLVLKARSRTALLLVL